MSRAWRGGSTSAWRRLRAVILDRDGRRCQVPVAGGHAGNGGAVCGAYATHVDHVVPRSKGGQDLPANLRAACRSCNLRRGAGLDLVDQQREPNPWRWSW